MAAWSSSDKAREKAGQSRRGQKTPHVVVTTVPPSGSTRVLQGGTAGHLERLLVGRSKGQHNVTGGG